MAFPGSHAREGIQGHYYLPLPVYDLSLCRSAGVPISHVDQLKTPQGMVDVSLNREEANELALRRRPRPELPPLADDLADTVAQARTATQASTDTTPVEFIPGSSTASSSFLTAPLPVLVPLAMVQKLETQMATLLIISSRGCRSGSLSLKSV